jgi:hypothetical protein
LSKELQAEQPSLQFPQNSLTAEVPLEQHTPLNISYPGEQFIQIKGLDSEQVSQLLIEHSALVWPIMTNIKRLFNIIYVNYRINSRLHVINILPLLKFPMYKIKTQLKIKLGPDIKPNIR